jgi:hypothetical protein
MQANSGSALTLVKIFAQIRDAVDDAGRLGRHFAGVNGRGLLSTAIVTGHHVTIYVFAGSRWIGSTHNTVSGFSTGSMSRLMAMASPSLRTSTHSKI